MLKPERSHLFKIQNSRTIQEPDGKNWPFSGIFQVPKKFQNYSRNSRTAGHNVRLACYDINSAQI